MFLARSLSDDDSRACNEDDNDEEKDDSSLVKAVMINIIVISPGTGGRSQGSLLPRIPLTHFSSGYQDCSSKSIKQQLSCKR